MVDRVTIYRAPTSMADADALAAWLEDRTGVPTTVADRFLADHIDDATATAFAETRVLSPYRRETGNTMLGIRRYERRVLDAPERGGGVLYDGAGVQEFLRQRLSSEDRGLHHAHVIFLDRPIATWGDHDGRWHKRIVVLGQPAVVSIPGLYEAPAKPEAYYREQQRHAIAAGSAPPREVLEAAVDGDFLLEDDPRTTDALKGYVLAAYHYLATGEAFCDDERCRLFNAHRHPELVRAQLEPPPFCPAHARQYD